MIRSIRYYPHELFAVWELNRMLGAAVSIVAQRVSVPHMQEPDYTAAIVTDFVNMAQHSRAFARARLGGSYIHQRPKVTFDYNGVPKTCELGDLLVLCRRIVDGESRFNAALMQLKMAQGKNYPTITNNGDQVQLYLYTQWPKFKCANGIEYDIQPKTVTLGAQYMFVNPWDYPLFTHHIPQRKMPNEDYLSFGRFLYDFVNWQNGRPIVDVNHKDTDSWSQLIWDIIEHNKNAYFRRRNIGVNQGNRNVFDFLVDIRSNHEDLGSDFPNDPQLETEGMACPILFIDYAEQQERE